jgi:hypothetical protein
MSDWTIKQATVPVPVTMSKGGQRGATWTAEVTVPSRSSWWRAEGKTEADAKRALAELLAAGLTRIEGGPVLLIGGAAPDYDTSIHLIVPHAHGFQTHAIRDGRRTCVTSHHRDATLDEVVAGCLEHVGGTPLVVRL